MTKLKIAIARLRGLLRKLKRMAIRVRRYWTAAVRDRTLLKVIMRVPGARIDPAFDPDRVRQYKPVGRCIYCGVHGENIKLTKEHILAYSLGGDAILRQASCLDCAKVTKHIEEHCADNIFNHIRVMHGVHSRRPKETHLPILETFEPTPQLTPRILVPVDDHPGVLILPSFDVPGIVAGQPKSHIFTGMTIHCWTLAEDTQERINKLISKGQSVKLNATFDVATFMRMLAKIGLDIAVATYGVDGFTPMVTDIILGKDPAIPYLVGNASDRRPPAVEMKTWARCEVRKIGSRRYVVVFFRLFAYLGTPMYSVVAGEFIPWWQRLCRRLGLH